MKENDTTERLGTHLRAVFAQSMSYDKIAECALVAAEAVMENEPNVLQNFHVALFRPKVKYETTAFVPYLHPKHPDIKGIGIPLDLPLPPLINQTIKLRTGFNHSLSSCTKSRTRGYMRACRETDNNNTRAIGLGV